MRDSVAAIGVGTGGPMGLASPTFISGGYAPHFFPKFRKFK